MGLPINPIVDAEPSSAVASQIVTIAADEAGILHIYTDHTLPSAQVLVNGTAQTPGTPVTLVAGDTLQVTGTAPSSNATAAFVNMMIEGFGFFSFALITKQSDGVKIVDTYYSGRPQSEFYGDSYVASNPQNRLLTVNVNDDSAVVTDIVSVDGRVLGERTLPYVFAADYIQNKVHRIHPDTGTVMESISIDRPHGLAYTPTESPNEETYAHTLVTSVSGNSVHVYNGDTHELMATVGVGDKPHGICGEPTLIDGDYSFWVACYGADRVERWKYTTATAALVRDFYYDLPNAGPYELAVDNNGNAWVSCLKRNAVAVCPAGGAGTVTYIDVGADPWGIELSSSHAYVACAGTSQVHAIDLLTHAVTPMTVMQNPTHIELVGSKLYVGSFNFGTFRSFTLLSATSLSPPTEIEESQRLFEGMIGSVDNSEVFAVNMHNDLPDRTTVPDNTPDNVAFISIVNADENVEVTSNVVNLQGMAQGSPFNIPPNGDVNNPINATLLINGQDSDTSGSASNSSTIAVRLTTPVNGALIPQIFIPVIYIGGVVTWAISLEEGLRQRVAGWIQGG